MRSTSEGVSFSTSQRGGLILHYMNYEYRQMKRNYGKKKSDNRANWRCRWFEKNFCCGTLYTVNNQVLLHTVREHNHAPNQDAARARLLQSKMREDARLNPDIRPRQIVEKHLSGLPDSVLQCLPSAESLISILRHIRYKDKNQI